MTKIKLGDSVWKTKQHRTAEKKLYDKNNE